MPPTQSPQWLLVTFQVRTQVLQHVLPPALLLSSPRKSALSTSKNTGVGCHALFQGIFLIQGSNLGLLHCRQILYHLPGKHKYVD